MTEIKETVNEQLLQLQMLMSRSAFIHSGRLHNPRRGQGRVLAILKLKPVISQRELTYLLNMSKQSVAELIAKLEKNGYVTREPSEDDKRVMTVRLTDEGAKAADDAGDAAPEALKVLDCLNDAELANLSEYLGRIIGQYEEQFPGEDFEQRRRYMESFMSTHGRGFAHWQGAGRGYGEGRHGCGHGPGHGRGRHGHGPAGMGHPPFNAGENENDGDRE